jgi:hypothetical protein
MLQPEEDEMTTLTACDSAVGESLSSMRARANALYAEWLKHDDLFQAALVARYGKDAGDMRYSYSLPLDLRQLADDMILAGEAWSTVYLQLPR